MLVSGPRQTVEIFLQVLSTSNMFTISFALKLFNVLSRIVPKALFS